MKIETVDELVEELANWLDIYGVCKHTDYDPTENKCTFEEKRPFCCRAGFQSVMGDRIRNAVKNDEWLDVLMANRKNNQ